MEDDEDIKEPPPPSTNNTSSSTQPTVATPTPQPKAEACIVCTEKFTKLQRRAIVCPYCSKEACLNCQKGYLTSSVHDAHCMFCKVGWNDDFIRDNFTNNWLVKEYGKIEMECLWQREKSLLPESMVHVERRKLQERFNENHRFVLAQLHKFQSHLQRIQDLYRNFPRVQPNLETLFPLLHQWNDKDRHINLGDNVDEATLIAQFGTQAKDLPDVQRAQHFHRPCPAPDCRGFLSTQYMCSLCLTKVCPQCFAIKRLYEKETNEEHKCNPDDILTAQLIRKETKSCPKCAASISKIEGCDQMFCTACNTAFSWKTLEIINRNIHNPHYFQWLNRVRNNDTQRQQQPAADGQACQNGMVDQWTLSALMRKFFSNSALNNILEIQRFMLHIHGTIMHPREMTRLNSQLREEYLMGNITEEKFKTTAYTRYKQMKFLTSSNQIIEMLHMAVASIVNELAHTLRSLPSPDKPVPQGMRAYTNIFPAYPDEKYLEHRALYARTMDSLIDIVNYYNTSMTNLFEKFKKDGQFDIIVIRPNVTQNYDVTMKRVTRKTKE